VQEGIYEKFIKALKQAVEAQKVGDGFDADVTQGPLINEDAVRKVCVSEFITFFGLREVNTTQQERRRYFV